MSIILSNTSPEEFKSNISLLLIETINWFQSNLLTLNCDKTNFLQYLTKKHSFSILSDDRFKASSKTIPPHSAI
jgi:hypothetical protein